LKPHPAIEDVQESMLEAWLKRLRGYLDERDVRAESVLTIL